jgi:hypothetical protein
MSSGGLVTTNIPWWPQKVTKPNGSCEPQEVSSSYSSVAEGLGFVVVWHSVVLWNWKLCDPSKCWELHVQWQKTWVFFNSAGGTWNLPCFRLFKFKGLLSHFTSVNHEYKNIIDTLFVERVMYPFYGMLQDFPFRNCRAGFCTCMSLTMFAFRGMTL